MSHLDALKASLREMGPVAVAVSGGVDSMTLAYVAHEIDPATEIYHALSPAVPTQATDRVKTYAERFGWSLRLIDAGEMNDADYLGNPVNRCYFCKTNLYETVTQHTSLCVVSGTNLDDLGDYRPGLIAASEHQVRHPFVEAGIDKSTLRNIARSLGLTDLSTLPAAPCLSSRVTTGIAIDAGLLPVINTIESGLWQRLPAELGVMGVRCRIRPEEVAIEIETSAALDTEAIWARDARNFTAETLRAAGYDKRAHRIVVEPYRRGSAFLVESVEVSP